MDKPWKVVCAFVLVFMAGAIFGGVFTVGFSARRLAAVTPKASPPAKSATQAAATALLHHTELDAESITRNALGIAAGICIYTNANITIEKLEID